MRGDDDAQSASSTDYAAVMFARERSTRGQMKSPSIAQRGEGGVRGGSGELRLLSKANPRRSVMPQGVDPIFTNEICLQPLSHQRKQLPKQ